MSDQPIQERPSDLAAGPPEGFPAPVAPTRPETPPPGAEWSSQAAPVPGWSIQSDAPAQATAPVEPVTVLRQRRGSVRWAVALLIVALVAGTASAAFIALSGSGASSTVAQWAPANSVLYSEVRLDLPGDQRAGLGQFLSAFPGFADQASLDSKLDEAFDKIVRSASRDSQDYVTKIKPWFGGQIAFALPSIPMPNATGTMPGARVAFLASVTDTAQATAWLASLHESGSSPATVDYGGVTLTVSSGSGEQFAYGVDGPVLVIGDVQTVHDVIDTKGTSGLATADGFKRALGAFHGDHLAFMYGDYRKLMTALFASMPASSVTVPQSFIDQAPPWFGVSVKASGGELTFDLAAPKTTLLSYAANDRTSALAGRLPGSTVVEYEAHDFGKMIKATVAMEASIPGYAASMKTLTDTLDRVGGLDSFTSWIGDTSLAVTLDGSTWGGGVVTALPDAASADVAAGKLATLRNLAALAGSGVTVTDATYNGATITSIDLGDLSSLAPSLGLPAGTSLGRASLAYTLSDGLVILGSDNFVKAVIDTKAGSSLADQARYKSAIGAAGTANYSQGYVDLRAIIDTVDANLPAAQRTQFDQDVKPYLDPFQAIGWATTGGDVQHAIVVVTVAK